MLLTTKSKESIVDSNLNLYSNIMRCGRELDEENSFCWRWTGFNYGLGFEMIDCSPWVIFNAGIHVPKPIGPGSDQDQTF